MSLIVRIQEELSQAMRDRDSERRDALRLILSSLQSAKKELQRELQDQEELQVLQRERKRRAEAAEAFRAGGAEEKAIQEDRELAVIEEFMPEQLSEEELESIIDDVIAECGATSMRESRPCHGRCDAAGGRPRRWRPGQPARPREAGLVVRRHGHRTRGVVGTRAAGLARGRRLPAGRRRPRGCAS